MADEKFLLKDELFNRQTVSVLTEALSKVYTSFNPDKFLEDALTEFPSLELKERMSYLTELITSYIPEDYRTTLNILNDSLNHVDNDHESFVFGAYQEYIMIHGCTDVNLTLSLDYMGKFTQYFSAEFAVRPFINQFPMETFKTFEMWAVSDNYHHRRLASEGIRPKLPWGKSISFDYKEAAKLLDHLYFDQERYVTRSVANHLNDISKIDPDFVVGTLKRWKESQKQDQVEMKYISNHALRTSIKRGHVPTLEFLGYKSNPDIEIHGFSLESNTIQIGDSIVMNFNISSNEDVSLMVDYNINYPMAGGKRSDKVFKIKKLQLLHGDSIKISKKHAFKVMTTKKLYTGEYRLNLQINGKAYDSLNFHLTVD